MGPGLLRTEPFRTSGQRRAPSRCCVSLEGSQAPAFWSGEDSRVAGSRVVKFWGFRALKVAVLGAELRLSGAQGFGGWGKFESIGSTLEGLHGAKLWGLAVSCVRGDLHGALSAALRKRTYVVLCY